MSKVKERSKLRQHIRARKKLLDGQMKEFISIRYIDPNGAKILVNSINELVALQRRLNAMSVEVDEKKILQRAEKRANGDGGA